jgi:hypothetical protein
VKKVVMTTAKRTCVAAVVNVASHDATRMPKGREGGEMVTIQALWQRSTKNTENYQGPGGLILYVPRADVPKENGEPVKSLKVTLEAA